MRNYKKLISLFAAVAMTVTGMPVTAMAAPKEMVNIEEAPAGGYSYLDGYTKKWGDEFDGNTLDPTVWNVELHDKGWVNSELQAYVNSEENIQVKDGRLNLIPVQKESVGVENIVKNADFSAESLDPWYKVADDGAVAEVKAENGAAKINITSGGANLWSTQLAQGISLKEGSKYYVRLDAESKNGRDIKVGVQHNGYDEEPKNYDEYKSKQVTLDAGKKQTIDFEFDATKDDSKVSFGINMGAGDGADEVTLSEIYIIELEKDLAKSPNFENKADWINGVNSPNAVTASKALVVDIKNAGGENDNQINQKFAAKAGGKYTVNLDIISSIDKKVNVCLQHDGSSDNVWDKYYNGQEISLSANELTHIEFAADNITADDDDARINITLGQQAGESISDDFTVKISNVSVTEELSGSSKEMIKNGDFSNGKSDWGTYFSDSSNTADVVSSTKGATVTIKDVGTDDYSVQLKQKYKMVKGAVYNISMKVKSSVDRTVNIGTQHDGDVDGDWSRWYAGGNTDLKADEVKEVKFDYTPASSDEDALLYISLGKLGDTALAEHTITISDVSIKQKVDKSAYKSGEFTYTSGRINTQNKQTFKYGLFEVKAKVPTGMGYLPAFWLMPNDEDTYGQWPRCGEIDCMEVMGQETDKVYGTIHYGNPHNQNQGTAKAEGKDFATEDHIFACEWLPGEIIWYVDGKEYYRTSNWFSATEGQGTVTYPAPFDQNFYVILNLAVGGEWVGYPDESTEYGADHAFSVDYVRVYQKDEYDEDVEEPVKEEVTLREPDENGNYIINGDFAVAEDLVEEKDWVFKTAQKGEATANIKDKSIAINTTAEGDVDYSVQLYQANIPLEKGSTYEVTFDAKASKERTMNVDIKAPDRSYKAYMETLKPALTKEFKSFRTEFVMSDETDANGRLEFNMGAAGTEGITIKNVALKKVAGPEEEEEKEEKKTVLADGNYIYNGKFQEGKNYLGYWDITKDDETTAKVTGFDDGRKLKVVLPKNPDEDFILGQDGLAFVSGKDYSVSLSAAADKDATLEVSIGGKTKIIPLKANEEFKPYTYRIPATAKFANNDLRIRIKSADAVTVYLDNISMTEDRILKNGDFNAGWTGFEVFTNPPAKVSKVIDSLTEDNAADFTIDNTGDADWKIQLIQYIKLEKGKTYKLSYDAKSDIDREIFAQIQHDPDNHKLGDKTDYENYAGTSPVEINNEWQTFEKTFTMTGETNPYAKFNICLGAVNEKQITTQHRVLIDNISVVEVSGEGGGDEPAEADKIVEIPDMVYTGSQVKPAVTVYDGDILLTPKKDYTVKYYNNISVNSERKGDTFNDKLPYVEVTLKGNYEGELKANFNINRFAIANSAGVETKGTVLSAIDQLATSNKDQSVFKSLKVNKKSLKTGENGDIDIALFDKDNNKMDAAKVSANGIGEYTLKVRGKGNYSGTIVKKIVVAEKGKLLKNAKITIGKNEKKKDYTGKLITLKPGYYDKENRKYYEVIDDKGTLSANACDAKDVFIVNAGGESLIYGKDYTVKYTNNLAVGKKATLVIEGKGEYYGTKSVNFEIKGRPFNKNTVSINAIADQDYTGDAIKPIIRAYYKQQGGNKPIYSGNHYTVKFLKNVNKGKATVILTGKASGGYTGTVKATFKINGLKLTDLVNETVSTNEVVFTKGGVNLPTDVVVLKNKDAELEAGKDFVVKKCVNNKKPANYDAEKAPTATIVLKGNYTGTFDVTYTILPADINNESVSINAVAVAYKENATKPYAPKVTVKDGKKSLAKGTDYTISYVNCAADEVKAYIEKKSSKAPKALVSGNSINGYVGTKEIPLQIFVNKMTAKNTILVIAPAVYSDKQVKPEVKVYFSTDKTVIDAAKAAIADGKANTLDSMEGLTKVAASNYSVSYGKNNVAGKNKGSVTINGTSCEYSGTVSAKFDIKEKSI